MIARPLTFNPKKTKGVIMREKKNVIVVMLDTLQFNYLGCYGNTRVKTPNIDRFATEGVVFENAYTEGLPTVPCRRVSTKPSAANCS